MTDLEGRVVLVTGGSRGIGRATAIALAEDGADVAVNFVSNEDAARHVVEHVERLGRRAYAYQADVGEMEQVEAMTAMHPDEVVGQQVGVFPARRQLRR